MIEFIIKFNVIISVLFVFYKLILENEKIHTFNRAYLLLSLLIALIFPLISINFISEIEVLLPSNNTFNAANFQLNNEKSEEKTVIFNLINFIYIIYVFIFGILMFRYFKNLFNFFKIIKNSEKIYFSNFTIVLIDEKLNPFSFLAYIFVNKEQYLNNFIDEELFLHEKTHVLQKHTIDILIIEFIKVIFWFNPLLYFYRKSIELNHEFLVDEYVISKVPIKKYQYLLLKHIDNKQYMLASNWNFLLTKYRIIMMTKKSNPRLSAIKKMMVLPLVALLFVIFCVNTVFAQKTSVIQKTAVEVREIPSKEFYYSKTEFVFIDKNKKILKKCNYNQLTATQKENLRSPLEIPERKLISNEYFQSIKDINKYAVWIDGKYVNKTILDSYKSTDFSYFTISHVFKNARSKKFPQENQVSLYTEKYYKENFEKIKPVGGRYIFAKWPK